MKPIGSPKETIKLEFINPFERINHALISKSISVPLSSPAREIKISGPNINKAGAFLIKDVVINGNKKDANSWKIS